MALDREIARLASEQEQVGRVNMALGGDEEVELKYVPDNPELLSEYVDNYKPANSHVSLEEQVFHAKGVGADSIEAEDIVFKALIGKVPKEPYMMYKDIKVYRIGMVSEGQLQDRMTVEAKMFGKR